MAHVNETKANAVFSSVIKKIKPNERETRKSFEVANSLIRKLERVVPPAVEVRLAGSLAKGTNLTGNNEFDIFLLFPKHYPHHEMTMLGLNYARRAFHGMKTESRYAEHPYMQVFADEYHSDIVPAYRINDISERGSSVDRSQMHTQYINVKLNPKAKEDVRLLKRFMKNFGIYGAEVRVEGFSGYLCELLIVKYGSLYELMKNASGWKLPVFDIENHHKGADLRKVYDAPLIVIDPVDPSRNVAAVVAQTSLSRFIFECRRFLKNPSPKFFFAQKTKRNVSEIKAMMKKRGTRCLALKFAAPKVVSDVLWPQLKKTAQALVKNLTAQDFSVFGYYHWSDGNECVILFELDRWELPAIRKAIGPSMNFASDVETFVKRHSDALNMHMEHEKIVAVERRETCDVKHALSHACRNMMGVGIPDKMQEAMAKFSIVDGNDIVKEKYAEFLADYFFNKIA